MRPTALALAVLLAACSSSTTPASTSTTDSGSSASSSTSCTDVCAHVKACDPTNTNCAAVCAGFSEECKSCVVTLACNAPAGACPACGGGSSGTPQCMTATPCHGSTDCPGSLHCNEKQGLCFNYSGKCVGQPCGGDTDCPTGEVCNSATGTCN